MTRYRIDRPIKWQGEIKKTGHIEADPKAVEALVNSGALVPDEAAPQAQADLDKLKVDELRTLAEQSGVEDFATLKKAELIAALQAAEQGTGQGDA
ncbi:Rho termination factor N-terminal domain-containing protein [Gallaecimonas kandeliae]|uniref:Rho termination factor N-terminal domain-containing protein n=1 Tax=Gallaecimonas kandeliae TaxID=3029055 RepID=UPI00264A2D83|nr:Rho termination factor N-terminal domain-containing protein [Gallaecimonas kandeliae]WKE65069.1 Rho termination factor N-terminal domain-containing protein [Gallaecimonas kandeliae]